MKAVIRLDENDFGFPDPEIALDDPDGLLAIGGDLCEERLLEAYRLGIFPWYSEREPILWWSPDPRCVLFPEKLHVSRSLAKTLRQESFEIREDSAFEDVIQQCAMTPRPGQSGESWITGEMQSAYIHLARQGHARSIECWRENRLVGGLYGIAIGPVFFGESMFSLEANASKVALNHLARCGKYALIDCQLPNEHLFSMGAECLPRSVFLQQLDALLAPAAHIRPEHHRPAYFK